MTTNNPGTQNEVSGTHSRVTRVLNKVLEIYEQRLDDYNNRPGYMFVEPSPAMLTVATRFLKDNNITCQVEETNEMGELQQRLEAKRKRGKVLASVTPLQSSREA